MNLIYDAWIPVRHKDGKTEKIAPWQVTENLINDPILELASVRPDFNGALMQFLIGLLQTTCAPNSKKEWREWRDSPPSPELLKQKFEEVAFAFFLDDDPRQKWDQQTPPPRFMQDLELEKETRYTEQTIEKLFLDAPGEQALKFNTDHFIKGGKINKLCLPCAAQALFTLQTNSPAGGKGNRVGGLRGGGPVTTIILEEDFWQTIWNNVLDKDGFEDLADKSRVEVKDKFPWCGATRVSDKDQSTTALDVNPVQIYWSMPRRIRLLFEDRAGECDLCNNSDVIVNKYLTKPYGVMYKSILHPLTPYYRDVKEELLPMHQHEYIGYKYWLGYIQTILDGSRQAAKIVNQTFDRKLYSFRLWTFGYDMNNMKACCWYEGIMPVVIIEDKIKREIYEAEIATLIKAADSLASSLRYAIKDALKVDVNKLSSITQRFWQETEADFYRIIARMRERVVAGNDGTSIKQEWHKCIVRKAEQIFDEVSQSEMIDEVNVKRVAQARNKLMGIIRGKKVKQDILGLPIIQEAGKDV